MAKRNSNQIWFAAGLFIGAFLVGIGGAFVASAFNGPGSNSAGSGNGAIGVNPANSISIGTSTPLSNTKDLIVGSTTDASAYALQVLQSNSGPILYIRNDGAISIATTTVTAGTLTVQGNLVVSGNITGGSALTTVPAANITTGLFNGAQSTSSGNFAFPASLGVNTSSQVGLPAPLSVYGNGYFSGALTGSNFNSQLNATFVGVGAGNSTVGSDTAVGYQALNSLTGGSGNTAFGISTLGSLQSGNSNVAMGDTALYNLNGGTQNVAIGAHVMTGNQSGSGNVGIGFQTLFNGFTFNDATALGYEAGYNASSGAANSVFLGYEAGYNANTGNNNVFLGYQAGYNASGSNLLYIANSSTSQPLVYGSFSGGLLGIDTSTPAQALSVQGNIYASGNITCGGSCGGGGGVTGGQNNFIPLWTGASTLATSTLQQNGTTTYTLNGLAIGTSSLQGAGTLYAAGNITTAGNFSGALSAGNISSGAFGNLQGGGNFAFPANLAIGTTTTALPSALSVYGSTLITGASTFSGSILASSSSEFLVPVIAGTAVQASGSIAYNTNNNLLESADGNVTGTIPRTIFFKALAGWSAGGTLASDTILGGTGSTETAFQTNYTIPANYMIPGKTLVLSFSMQVMSPATQPSETFKVEMRKAGVATTTIYTSVAAAFCSATGTTCSAGTTLYISALSGPSTTASVSVAQVGGNDSTGVGNFSQNKTAQPVTVDTTAPEILQITNTYGSGTLATTSLILYSLEEVN